MSCPEISTIVAYNSMPITTRCGEVYCCENLENFLIYCGTCPQQFNLLSCTLFIKHIKECKRMDFQNIEEQNFVSQDSCNYAIDNIFKDSLTSNNIDSGGGIGAVNHTDPLLHPKLEMIKEKEVGPPSLEESNHYLITKQEPSDCESIDSKKPERDYYKILNDPPIISDLIAQYKQYPFLWDQSAPLYNCKYAKNDAFCKITVHINNKFNTNVTQRVVEQQIENILKMYENTSITNDDSDKDDPIHYDEKMLNCLKVEVSPEENDEEPIKFEHNGEEERQNPNNNNRELILIAMIEEYRKLPCLWAVKYYSNDNAFRRKAFEKIAKNVNEKFNTSYNYKDISSQIIKLRASYKRLIKRKEKDPTCESKVWYVEKLSFIEGKAITTEQNNGQESNEILSKVNECEEDNMEEIYNKKNKIKSKAMVFKIIDLYKAAPILWDTYHPRHALRTDRRKAIKQIIDVLAREHDCDITIDEFRNQIRFLRSTFYRNLRQENISQTEGDIKKPSHIPKPFFIDRLSFLVPYAEKFPINEQNFNPEIQECEEDFTYLVENKPLMINFIEVYKAHACLWKAKDKDKNNSTAHSEAYDKIIKTFLKYKIILTKEQVLAAIGFLHFSYVKQQKINDKNSETGTTSDPPIWFYDNLLFLRNHEKQTKETASDRFYQCPVCNARFDSRSMYACHQITHKEPHKCDQCEFQTYKKHNFVVHMQRHKGITNFKCPECEKAFVTANEVKRHMRFHTGERPYVCDICGKSYTSSSEFGLHIKRHNNERDHKCDLCGNAFLTPKNLRDHMTSHSNERQHACGTCGAAFKRRKTLLQHEALHAEVKKHECKICGKMFAQKAGVYSHMKSHDLMPES